MHQSKKLNICSNINVVDYKIILGQKYSHTLPFFGPFLGIFGPFEQILISLRIKTIPMNF